MVNVESFFSNALEMSLASKIEQDQMKLHAALIVRSYNTSTFKIPSTARQSCTK